MAYSGRCSGKVVLLGVLRLNNGLGKIISEKGGDQCEEGEEELPAPWNRFLSMLFRGVLLPFEYISYVR